MPRVLKLIMVSVKTTGIALAVIGFIVGFRATKAELDPLAGRWIVDSVELNGEWAHNSFHRTWLEISPRHKAVFADYHTCGVPSYVFAEGKVIEGPGQVQIEGDTPAVLNCEGEALTFTFDAEDGTLKLTLIRESNAETIFNLFGS